LKKRKKSVIIRPDLGAAIPGSINKQRTKLTMNHLTILPIYTVGMFADYSRPQSASDEKPATSDELKLSNEPNLFETNPLLLNEPNLHRGKVTHLIKEQQTMNKLQTNPITAQTNVTSVMTKYYINEPRTMKNELFINKQRTMNNEQFTNEPNFANRPLRLLRRCARN